MEETMKTGIKWPLHTPNSKFSPDGRAQFPVTMVPTGDDPRIAQLVALFGRCDERGKLVLLRMAACMPGMKEVG